MHLHTEHEFKLKEHPTARLLEAITGQGRQVKAFVAAIAAGLDLRTGIVFHQGHHCAEVQMMPIGLIKEDNASRYAFNLLLTV